MAQSSLHWFDGMLVGLGTCAGPQTSHGTLHRASLPMRAMAVRGQHDGPSNPTHLTAKPHTAEQKSGIERGRQEQACLPRACRVPQLVQENCDEEHRAKDHKRPAQGPASSTAPCSCPQNQRLERSNAGLTMPHHTLMGSGRTWAAAAWQRRGLHPAQGA